MLQINICKNPNNPPSYAKRICYASSPHRRPEMAAKAAGTTINMCKNVELLTKILKYPDFREITAEKLRNQENLYASYNTHTT